jgi:hypothetical protein
MRSKRKQFWVKFTLRSNNSRPQLRRSPLPKLLPRQAELPPQLHQLLQRQRQ